MSEHTRHSHALDHHHVTPSPRHYAPRLPDDVFRDMLSILYNHPSHMPEPPALVTYLNEEAHRRFFRDWMDAAMRFRP